MKYLFLTLIIIFTSCTKYNRYIIHTKDPNPIVQSNTGERCIVSGYDVSDNLHITYYKNCPVTLKRELKPHEHKQWP